MSKPAARAWRLVRYLRLRILAIAGVALLALAALEAAVGVLVVMTTPAADLTASWPAFLNLVLFGAAGGLLVLGGASDRRLQLLGALFVLIAAAFADPFFRHTRDGILAALGNGLRAAPAESFFALALWLFARSFPHEPLRRFERGISLAFIAASAALGATLLAFNVALSTWPGPASTTFSGLTLFNRHDPTGAFWPMLLGLALPALPYLVWKSRFGSIDEKRRVTWFVGALAAGLAPMLLTVTVSPAIPALTDPEWQQLVGVLLYASLAAVVPATVYAVAVHRVMTLDLIVRRTVQYAVARHSVWVASVVPLG